MCVCPEQHATYGACLRAKNLSYNGCFPTRSPGFGNIDGAVQKRWDKELDAYRAARKQGIQPAGTTMPAIRDAVQKSDRAGVAYDASASYTPEQRLRFYKK